MNIKKAISLKINIGCGDTPTKGWRNYNKHIRSLTIPNKEMFKGNVINDKQIVK